MKKINIILALLLTLSPITEANAQRKTTKKTTTKTAAKTVVKRVMPDPLQELP